MACLRMSGKTFKDPGVKKLMDEHFVFVELNVDKNKGAADQMGIVGIPDTRILAQDGKLLDQVLGFEGPEAFAQRLKRHIERKDR